MQQQAQHTSQEELEQQQQQTSQPTGTRPIPPFTRQELDNALKQLKNKRAEDSAGVVAEMLKQGGETLHDVLLDLYNETIKPNAAIPSRWKRTVIKVLHKSGDPQTPQNYRPISIIPILYKLFARLLYNRLVTTLDTAQTIDQAGFRSEYSTTDHLFTIHLVMEKAREWNMPVWIAALDFKKAFDTVSQEHIWAALRRQGVAEAYVTLLTDLYDNQVAVVQTDKTSKPFNIERGTKQGDPLSALLFTALLEDVVRNVKTKWENNHNQRAGLKIDSGATTRLTNLRFADDVLLIASCYKHVWQMLDVLCVEAKQVGLELHPDRTKILSNTTSKQRRRVPPQTQIQGMTIEVLICDKSIKYLGRQLTFAKSTETEVESRISNAWKKFDILRNELTSRSYALKDRLRLFNGVITPTVLYANAAWTLARDLEIKLRRTWRRMLRMIIQIPRRKVPNDNRHNDRIKTN